MVDAIEQDDPASDWSHHRFWRTVTPENVIKRLAETGGVNAVNEYGEIPLAYAALHSSVEVFTAMLEAGAEIDEARIKGWHAENNSRRARDEALLGQSQANMVTDNRTPPALNEDRARWAEAKIQKSKSPDKGHDL